jgi:hypothetical protein
MTHTKTTTPAIRRLKTQIKGLKIDSKAITTLYARGQGITTQEMKKYNPRFYSGDYNES